MKSQWVTHKLSAHIPSRFSSLLSPSKTLIYESPHSKTSAFVLNHVDASMLLSICGREGYVQLGSSLHASIIKNPEFFEPEDLSNRHNVLAVWNSLLSVYAKCGVLREAAKLFDEMPMRDTVSWNTMISGFFRSGKVDSGFRLLKQMLESGSCNLDPATLTTVLSVCDKTEFCSVNKMIHSLVFSFGYENEMTVGNALMTSYFKCGCSSSGRQVFDEMVVRNVVSWTAVISGLVQNELYEDSLNLFVKMQSGLVSPNTLTHLSSIMACSGSQALKSGEQIHALLWKHGIQSDFRIESALMDMYSKCGRVNDVWRVFESAEEPDEVSMTVMLVGLAQNGFDGEAVHFFLRMVRAGVEIDMNIISAVLGVFGVVSSLALGKQLHSLAIKRSFSSNPFVNNGLINMYSKCGELNDSIKIFNQILEKNPVSWNSMIAAFARHGEVLRALKLYEEMIKQGNKPTDVTFLSLLHACSHMGLIKKGMEFFNSMVRVYGINPRAEHYACVVDMLGRAGLLHEAKTFIEAIPVEPDALVWQALLGACSFHGDSDTGKYASERLFLEAPGTASPYILMANIYSSKGRWRERAKTIRTMKEMGVAKGTGISWIETEQKVHSFVVEDKMHPEAETIYQVLHELFMAMVDEGYKPDKRFILYYLDEEENDSVNSFQ